MSRADLLESLAKLPAPVLTVYVNTAASDASRHPPVQPCVAWFQAQTIATGKTLPSRDAKQFEHQAARIERFLVGRHPEEKALVILAGPKTWRLVPLQVTAENQLHWGRPALGQLFRVLNEHKPYGVILVDHSGVRFFVYHIGELTSLGEKTFEIDESQWKKKELGHVTSEQVQKSRGANRDLYEHRLEAQYEHLCRETADEAVILAKKYDFAGVFLVGPDRVIAPIQRKLPQQFNALIASIPEDFRKLSPREARLRLEPRIAEFERQRQINAVEKLLAEEGKSVANPDEILAQMQNGTFHTVVVASNLDLRLRECVKCGAAKRSADPVCANCGGELRDILLLEVLPRLSAAQHTKVEFVSGAAAQLLAKAGGIGGWFRQPSIRPCSHHDGDLMSSTDRLQILPKLPVLGPRSKPAS